MATKTPKISQDTWNLHKETILSLYLTSDLHLPDLVQAMNRDHAFPATTSQFEAQLKAWKARKNLKRLEWKCLLEKIDHLSSQGIQSRVVISGHPVSTDRVNRARRYCKGEPHPNKRRRVESDINDTANNCDISDAAVEIQDQSGRWTQYTNATDSDDIETGSGSAPDPDTQFQRVEDNGDSLLLVDYERQSTPRPGHVSPQLFPFDISSENLYPTIDSWHFPPSLDTAFVGPELPAPQSSLYHEPDTMMAFPTLEVATSPVRSVEVTQFQFGAFCQEELPFERLEREWMLKGLKLAAHPSPMPDSRLFSGAQKLAAVFLQDAIAAMECKNTSRGNAYRAFATIQNLETILPRAQQNYGNSSMVHSTGRKPEVDLHRLLLFSAANGFVGMGEIPIEAVLRFLDHSSNVTSLLSRFFQESKSPIAKSLAENLFRAAIEASDHQKTGFFLQTGLVDVNNTFCFVDNKRFTPIERAAQLQALKVIRELLTFNPDVNRTLKPQTSLYDDNLGQALGCLIHPWTRGLDHRSFRPEYLETVDALINAGAEINRKLIHISLTRFSDMSLARTLLNKLAPSRHAEAMSFRNPEYIAREFPDEISKEIISKIILDCEQSGCKKCVQSYSGEIHMAMICGAERGRMELLRFLFQYKKDIPIEVLSAAIRSGVRELIDLLLAQNLDLRQSSSHPEWLKTSPFAEAILLGDKELIKTLEGKGALSSLSDQKLSNTQLIPVLAAASKIGDIEYVKKLLLICSEVAMRDIGAAYMAAIEGRQVNVLRFLLNLWLPGAKQVTSGFSWDEVLTRLYKWGEKSILRDILTNIPDLPLTDMENIHHEELGPKDMDMLAFFSNSGLATKYFLTDCLGTAAKHNDRSMVELLLERGADASDENVLNYGVVRHPDLLRLILAAIPPSKNYIYGFGQETIQNAIEESNMEALDIILNSKRLNMKPTQCSYSLTVAIDRDVNCSGIDFPFVSKMLDAGFDMNSPTSLRPGETPFSMAIKKRNLKLAQFLVDRGADINKEAIYSVRQTPLQAAAEAGCLDIVELLLRNGADVNAKPALLRGGTALQYAAGSGNCNIVITLIEHGADICAAPSEFGGKWPIEAAAENGRLEMIQFLWNISMSIISIEQYRKAMELAEKNGHMGCRELISQLAVLSGLMPAIEG